MADFGISRVELSGSAITVLLNNQLGNTTKSDIDELLEPFSRGS
jgi:hypothetical protein